MCEMIINLESHVSLPHGYHVLLSVTSASAPWAISSWGHREWPEAWRKHQDMKLICDYLVTVNDRTGWYLRKNAEYGWVEYHLKSTINYRAYDSRYGGYVGLGGWYGDELSETALKQGLASGLSTIRRDLNRLGSNQWTKSVHEIHEELFENKRIRSHAHL